MPSSEGPHEPIAAPAPAARVGPRTLEKLTRHLQGHPVVQAMLDAFAGVVMVLDEQRQMVAANAEAAALAEAVGLDTVLGLRPGEIPGCTHAALGLAGCGSGPSCQHCGAIDAILAAQATGMPATRSCLLTLATQAGFAASDLRVRATPLQVEGRSLMTLVLQDQSEERRKEVLDAVLGRDIESIAEVLKAAAEGPAAGSGEGLAALVIDLATQVAEHTLGAQVLGETSSGALLVDLRVFDPNLLLDDIRAAFESHPLVAGRTLEVLPAKGAMVETDPVLLSRVLLAMVRNALEASRPGDRVQVWFEVAQGAPTFRVSNPEILSRHVAGRIFQRSFSTKTIPGRGLGTYTMKLLGERFLGGRVSFSSRVGEGTVFQIALPVASLTACALPPAMAAPLAVVAAPEAPQTVGSGGRILIIDDSRTVLSILAKVLGGEHEVLTANRGEAGLKLASEQRPDLVLLDVVMPGLDGYEVCARLKADPDLADIPVIFLSAQEQEEDEAIGLELGAIDYLTKPISPAIVSMRVRNHLALKRYRDLLAAQSYQDGLTGIANRRRFDEVLGREWARSLRQQEPLSLLLGDVDHFKLYNDGYGHLAGDECLRQVAATLRSCTKRGCDLVARYGGEEFVILLPGTPVEGAAVVAERVLERMRERELPHAFSAVAPHVTLSLGCVTRVPDASASPETLVQAADKALYSAKQAGRNRCHHET